MFPDSLEFYRLSLYQQPHLTFEKPICFAGHEFSRARFHAAMLGVNRLISPSVQAAGPKIFGRPHRDLAGLGLIKIDRTHAVPVPRALPAPLAKLIKQYEILKGDVTRFLKEDLGTKLILRDKKTGQKLNAWLEHNGNAHPVNQTIADQADIVICCHPELLPDSLRRKHPFPDHTGRINVWRFEEPDESGQRMRWVLEVRNHKP